MKRDRLKHSMKGHLVASGLKYETVVCHARFITVTYMLNNSHYVQVAPDEAQEVNMISGSFHIQDIYFICCKYHAKASKITTLKHIRLYLIAHRVIVQIHKT